MRVRLPLEMLAVAVLVLVFLSPGQAHSQEPAFQPGPFPQPMLPLDKIKLPPGFSISLYAYPLPAARGLTHSPSGTVFVGSSTPGLIYALTDADGDGRAERIRVVASGLMRPYGIDFKDGDLYFSAVTSIYRIRNIEAKLDSPTRPELLFDAFPSEERHGARFIKFGPDGSLYVAVGVPCNVCDNGDPFGTLTRMSADFSSFEVVARGIRNTVGFDWHPQDGAIWFTDNGRDDWGHGNVEITDNNPPDELNRLALNNGPIPHFGFPYFSGQSMPDPDGFGEGKDPEDYLEPVQDLGPHVAALGMRFYDGQMFPPEYQNTIIIAEHGSWNRSEPLGARLMQVRLDAEGNSLGYEVFAEGWQNEEGFRWGRPVDVEVMPDGSLLVSDDFAGAVYRISYGTS